MGQAVAHYRIVGKLGVGGMGIIYDAEDQGLARRVALKFFPDDLAEDADAMRRLKREAQTIALLNHPRATRGEGAGFRPRSSDLWK